MQFSPSRDDGVLGVVKPHARRRQVLFGGMVREGSSVSVSGSGSGCGVGVLDCGVSGAEEVVETATRLGTGAGMVWSLVGVGAGAGVSSIMECLPVVQGGIERNSSKVRTRGLQHFQPGRR